MAFSNTPVKRIYFCKRYKDMKCVLMHNCKHCVGGRENEKEYHRNSRGEMRMQYFDTFSVVMEI